jgi:hypothetical protein
MSQVDQKVNKCIYVIYYNDEVEFATKDKQYAVEHANFLFNTYIEHKVGTKYYMETKEFDNEIIMTLYSGTYFLGICYDRVENVIRIEKIPFRVREGDSTDEEDDQEEIEEEDEEEEEVENEDEVENEEEEDQEEDQEGDQE